MLTHAHLKLTRLARAKGGVAHPPNWGEVGAHFHNLGWSNNELTTVTPDHLPPLTSEKHDAVAQKLPTGIFTVKLESRRSGGDVIEDSICEFGSKVEAYANAEVVWAPVNTEDGLENCFFSDQNRR